MTPDIIINDSMFSGDLDNLFATLFTQTEWKQNFIYGHPIPRLTSWFGDVKYTYSGITNMPKPMTPLLTHIKEIIEDEYAYMFNSVLLNYYKDGNSSIGFHSDDEPELGVEPIIASLSLGTPRDLVFVHKKSAKKFIVPDTPGRLIIMKGNTQRDWTHGIMKSKATFPRINLTFRLIKDNII